MQAQCRKKNEFGLAFRGFEILSASLLLLVTAMPISTRAQTISPLAQCVQIMDSATRRVRALSQVLRQVQRCPIDGDGGARGSVNQLENDLDAARRTIAKIVEKRLLSTGLFCTGVAVAIVNEQDGTTSAKVRGSTHDLGKVQKAANTEFADSGLRVNLDGLSAVSFCVRPLSNDYHAVLTNDGSKLRLSASDTLTSDEERDLPGEKECSELGSRFRAELSQSGPTIGFWIHLESGTIALCRPHGKGFAIKDLNIGGDHAITILRSTP